MGALVEIKEEQLQELDRLAVVSDRPRESLIEDALRDYLKRHRADARRRAFGLWQDFGIDGLEYQQRLRTER